MEKLYELKEMLCRELEKYASKEISASTLEYIDKLAHAIKNIEKIIESDSGMSRRGSYGEYEGTFAPRRDRMGRYSREYSRDYSRHGDMVEELRELMNDAPENTKHEFRKFIQKIETM